MRWRDIVFFVASHDSSLSVMGVIHCVIFDAFVSENFNQSVLFFALQMKSFIQRIKIAPFGSFLLM